LIYLIIYWSMFILDGFRNYLGICIIVSFLGLFFTSFSISFILFLFVLMLILFVSMLILF